MELAAKPMANPAVLYQRVMDDEAVLVNPDTAAALALNPSGCVGWQLVDGAVLYNPDTSTVCLCRKPGLTSRGRYALLVRKRVHSRPASDVAKLAPRPSEPYSG